MKLLQNKCTLKELEATCMDLIVHPDIPFLGATPDGIVCDKGCTGLIVVKCPYSVRDMTVDDACEERTDFFLSKKATHLHLSNIMHTGTKFRGNYLQLVQNFVTL